jgi:hypothetical protein
VVKPGQVHRILSEAQHVAGRGELQQGTGFTACRLGTGRGSAGRRQRRGQQHREQQALNNDAKFPHVKSSKSHATFGYLII